MTRALERLVTWAGRYVDISALNLRAALLRWLEQISRFLLSWGAQVVGNIASFIAQAVVAFFTLFFLFRDSKLMLARAAAVLPVPADQVQRRHNRTNGWRSVERSSGRITFALSAPR